MKKYLFTIISIVAFAHSGHTQSWVPALTVPYIPVQKAQPLTQSDFDQISAEVKAKHSIEVAECTSHAKNLYHSFSSYPNTVADGWHKITASDETTLCSESIVYVQGGRIKRWFYDVTEAPVEASTVIEKGKAVAKVYGTIVNCYFIDAILDPTSHTEEPKSGSVNFYTSSSKIRGGVDIYVDGKWVGVLNKFFTSGTPECGQESTVKITRKPGTYSYVATCEKLSWRGTIEIKEGQCHPFALNNR